MFSTENTLRFVDINHFCDHLKRDKEDLKEAQAQLKEKKKAWEEQKKAWEEKKKQIQKRDGDIKRRRKQCARLFAGYDANIPGSEKHTAVFKITEIILNTTRTRKKKVSKKVFNAWKQDNEDFPFDWAMFEKTVKKLYDHFDKDHIKALYEKGVNNEITITDVKNTKV